MKKILPIVLLFITVMTNAQEKQIIKNQTVEVACGQCKLGMTEKKGCDLAVRINGKSYFVDGTGLDDHGDAHAEDGFCSTIREALVSGEIIGNRFKAKQFKLLPKAAAKKNPKLVID
jgi:hypothetical protein